MKEEKKEQKKSLEEMLHDAGADNDFISELTPEELKHWNNIAASILELRKLQKENSTTSGNWLLVIFLFYLWGSDFNLNGFGNNNNIKEDNEANTSKL